MAAAGGELMDVSTREVASAVPRVEPVADHPGRRMTGTKIRLSSPATLNRDHQTRVATPDLQGLIRTVEKSAIFVATE